MKIGIIGLLLSLVLGLPVLYAQSSEESVDSNESPSTTTVSTSTTTQTTTTTTSGAIRLPAPGWVHMVRLAAVAGPFAFLFLAWLIGGFMHLHLVRREQAQFPALRGTRSPQWMPMMTSALLFLVPAILFAIFEIRSRMELRAGLSGVIDEWQPVMHRAWVSLAVCLVFAVVPWLLARRADTVS